jgi:hypothetical protein
VIAVLTPDDIARRMHCTRRLAFKFMRRAGALRSGKSDLRITEERFDEWLRSEMGSTNADQSGGFDAIRSPENPSQRSAKTSKPLDDFDLLASDLPQIRPTQPRKRRASTSGLRA